LAEWCGMGDPIEPDTFVAILPMPSGDRAVVVELPKEHEGFRKSPRAHEPEVWDSTRLAMASRRRPGTLCVSGEAIFEWLMHEMLSSLELGLLGPIGAGGMTSEERDDMCQWLRARLATYAAVNAAVAESGRLFRTVTTRMAA
jgi:hypothetical protein